MYNPKYLLFVLVLVLCIAFSACSGQGDDVEPADGTASSDTVADTENVDSSADTNGETAEDKEPCYVRIGGVDSSEYSIVVSSDDSLAVMLAEYISDSVSEITGNKMNIVYVAESADLQENIIYVGDTSLYPELGVGKGEFIVKLSDGKLYIVYDADSSPFQAISSVLDDSLFSENTAESNVYSMEDGFEFSGKCGDYIIGDNEFNPFD